MAARLEHYVRRGMAIGAVFLVVGPLGACSSTKRTETVSPVSSAERGDDAYPDFSRPLTSAMSQMTDEEAARLTAEFSELSARRRSGAISESEYWRRVEEMRRLHRSMSADATE